jgi:Mn2+/Fe2+ NRAMP family transporter
MGTTLDAEGPAKLERAEARFGKLIGPGLIVAATGIGAGDVVSAIVGGARYGEILLWGILLGAFFKYVLNEGVARFQLATGLTDPLVQLHPLLPSYLPIPF